MTQTLKVEHISDFILDHPHDLLKTNLFETEEAKELLNGLTGAVMLEDGIMKDRAYYAKFVQSIAAEMFAMMNMNGGVGLAANQVSCKYPIIVVNDRVNAPEAFIFPRIVRGYGKHVGTEQCLSCLGKEVQVKRYHEIEIEYISLWGERKRKKRHGWSARVISHEISHLNGQCITDLSYEPDIVEPNPDYNVALAISSMPGEGNTDPGEPFITRPSNVAIGY